MANELPSSLQKDSIDWEIEAAGEDDEEGHKHQSQALIKRHPNPSPRPNKTPTLTLTLTLARTLPLTLTLPIMQAFIKWQSKRDERDRHVILWGEQAKGDKVGTP